MIYPLWSGYVLFVMTSNNLVYYDTNVWVAWMCGSSDYFFENSKRLIDDVNNGEKTVAVSYIGILEIIHVLRRKIIKNYRFEEDDLIHRAQIENKIKANIEKFLLQIHNLIKRGQAFLLKPNIDISDHHKMILRKMNQHFGRIKIVGKCTHCKNSQTVTGLHKTCPDCGSNLSSVRTEYTGLGHVDLEHALLARLYNVKEFYSSDRSFECLNDDDDFEGMRFQTVPSKHD